MKSPKNFIHLVNGKSANVGNFALKSGVEQLFSNALPFNIKWTDEHWDDYSFLLKKFDINFVNLINKYDALIVSGAVAFNGRSYYKNTGCRFDIPLQLLEKINKPIIFFGLSNRVWADKEYFHLDKLKLFLNFIRNSDNCLLAVRDDGTKKCLSNLINDELDFIHKISDTGMFVKPSSTPINQYIKKEKTNIIISFNDEDRLSRFKGNSRQKILNNFAILINQLCKKYDANIILVPHYFDDYKAIGELTELIEPSIGHRYVTASGLAGLNDGKYFYSLYKEATLAISMRVHSISPSIGLNLPVIAVSSQDRITKFMTKLGLESLLVDAFTEDLVDIILIKVDKILQNREDYVKLLKKVSDKEKFDAENFIIKECQKLLL